MRHARVSFAIHSRRSLIFGLALAALLAWRIPLATAQDGTREIHLKADPPYYDRLCGDSDLCNDPVNSPNYCKFPIQGDRRVKYTQIDARMDGHVGGGGTGSGDLWIANHANEFCYPTEAEPVCPPGVSEDCCFMLDVVSGVSGEFTELPASSGYYSEGVPGSWSGYFPQQEFAAARDGGYVCLTQVDLTYSYEWDCKPKILNFSISPTDTGYEANLKYRFNGDGGDPDENLNKLGLEYLPEGDIPGGVIWFDWGPNANQNCRTDGSTPATRSCVVQVPPDALGKTLVFSAEAVCGNLGEPPIDIERRRSQAFAVAPDGDRECPCGGGGAGLVGGLPSTCVGGPIRVGAGNGNMRFSDTEPIPGASQALLSRTYDSGREKAGFFGWGWTSVFDANLSGLNFAFQTLPPSFAGPYPIVILSTEQDDRLIFRLEGGIYRQVYPEGKGNPDLLVFTSPRTYTLRPAGGEIARLYNPGNGKVIALRNVATGEGVTINYAFHPLRPRTVEDDWGRWTWNLAYPASVPGVPPRIESISVAEDPAILWRYLYDGDDRLTGVQAPGSATWREYLYETGGATPALANNLTRVLDGLGNLIEGHSYDGFGKAISSEGQADDVTGIEHNLPGRVLPPDEYPKERETRVTSGTGLVTSFYTRAIAGRVRTVEVDGNCSCGTRDGVFLFDAEGNVVREQDARGYVTLRTYSAGKLASESVGYKVSYGVNNCDPETAPDHCRLTYDDFLAVGNAQIVPTAAARTTSWRYKDPNWPDRPTRSTTASVFDDLVPGAESTEETVYDAATGQVLVRTETGYTGDTPILQTRQTTTALYNGGEDAVFVPCSGATTSCGWQAQWSHLSQPAGLVKSVDGPRVDVADVTRYVYYPRVGNVPGAWRGRLAAVKDALGNVTRWDNYDLFGNARRTIDANGVMTEMTYDALGRLVATTLKALPTCNLTLDPLCQTDLTTQRFYYPFPGSLTREVKPSGAVTAYAYDGRGRVQSVSRGPSVSELQERIAYEYDPGSGRKSAERFLEFKTGAWIEKKSTKWAYDAFGQLELVFYPPYAPINPLLGDHERFVYDPVGNLAAHKDLRHSSPNREYRYDPLGRTALVRDLEEAGAFADTTYAYDSHGGLTVVEDANGNITTSIVDDFGETIRSDSQITGTTVTRFNQAGLPVERTDARGVVETNSYDENGLRTNTTWDDGGKKETIKLAYDALGRRIFGLSETASESWQYDRRGLIVQQSQDSFTESSLQAAYRHDVDGNHVGTTYPTGRVVEYDVDYAGRPIVVRDLGTRGRPPTAYVSDAQYEPFGPLRTFLFGNGARESRVHDERYRLTDQFLIGSGMSSIVARHYTLDAGGNPTAVADADHSQSDRTFAYDDRDRLIQATGPFGILRYQNDQIGNRLTEEASGETTTITTSYTYAENSAGKNTALLAEIERTEAGGPTVVQSVTHDAVGNILDDGPSCYGYGPRNRFNARLAGDGCSRTTPTILGHSIDGYLIRQDSLEGPTAHVSYFITDPGGRRITSRDTWDLLQLRDNIWFGDLLVAFRSTGSSVGTIFGPAFYVTSDHLGFPLLTVGEIGEVAWRGEAEPFGRIVKSEGSADPGIRFPGQWEDTLAASGGETLLFDNHNRTYSPTLGSYTQADPMSYNNGSPAHLFAYVANRPTVWSDPTGLYSPGDVVCRRQPPDPIKGEMKWTGSDVIVIATDSNGAGNTDLTKGKITIFTYGSRSTPQDSCKETGQTGIDVTPGGAGDPYKGFTLSKKANLSRKPGTTVAEMRKRAEAWKSGKEGRCYGDNQCFDFVNRLTGNSGKTLIEYCGGD